MAVRDARDVLPGALEALGRQSLARDRFEVIVVDDGSTDGTADLAERSPVDARVIRQTRPAGAGAARNAGAAAAQGRVLAFTDADCEPAEEWLAEGLRAIEDADLVQGRVLPPPDARPGPFDRMLVVPSEYGLYETANLLIRRDRFEAVGGFEDLIVFGARGSRLRRLLHVPSRPMGEDTLLGWRVRRSGGRTRFAAGALVYHRVFPADWRDTVGERARDGLFALIVRDIPELRRHFFYRSYFLSRRSAAFDLALVGVLASLGRRPPLALVAVLPYARGISAQAGAWSDHPRGPVVAAAVAGDAVGLASLLVGSVAARRLLL